MDRGVDQSINLICEVIFDPKFTDSNFSFRKGKSEHQAIRHLQGIVREGHEWCAAIDLKIFFDEVPYHLILRLIRRKIVGEQLVALMARALKAGVIVNGKLEKTTKGCTQGLPIITMIANIVPNELDSFRPQEAHRLWIKMSIWQSVESK